MKHKILINGRSSNRVADFIQHTESFFNAVTTSNIRQDILAHFRFFDPEAFVCFVEAEYELTIDLINDIKSTESYNGAAIIIIADGPTCDKIEKQSVVSVNLLIRRPVTPDNMALQITRYLDEVSDTRRLERQLQEVEELAAAPVSASAADTSVDESAAGSRSNEKKHILIVDDDRTVLKMLKSALSDTYEVTTMINGMMVDKLFESKKIDLIILDYEMPIETGAEIFKRIKKNPIAARVPVCFLTGVSDKEKILEVMSLKPHGYLLKPIDMDMLSSTVKNLTK